MELNELFNLSNNNTYLVNYYHSKLKKLIIKTYPNN